MSLPSQENPNGLTQQSNSSDETFGKDWIWESYLKAMSPNGSAQQLNSQPQLDAEVESGSVPQNEDSGCNWRPSLQVKSPNQMNQSLNSNFENSVGLEVETNSVLLISYPDQLLNSQPNRSHQDQEERPSGQASNEKKPRVNPVIKAKNQLDQAVTSAKAFNPQKRKSREPVVCTKEQENERKKKKNESDRQYRAFVRKELEELRKIKPVYNRLMTIASSFGGIDRLGSQINSMNSEIHKLQEQLKEMEAESHRLQLMKSKYGDIEEIESMLGKFKNMEADSHRLQQIKMLFGGIDEIELEIDRLKSIERQTSPCSLQQLDLDHCKRQQQRDADFQRFEQMKSKYGGTEEMELKLDKFHWMEAELHKWEQIKSEFGIDSIEAEIDRLKEIKSQPDKHKELQFFPDSPGSLQVQCGSQSLDLNGDSGMVSGDGISLRSPATAAETDTTHEMQYSDALVTKFLAKLEDGDAASTVDLSSFKDLDGERKRAVKYSIPLSLVSTAGEIVKAYGDITKNCKFSPSVIETIYVLFCAAIKEMSDLSLEQVTEEVMLKWRDAIKDADRSACDVEFALKHLKNIAYGYFGLRAYNDRNCLKQRMTNLKAEEEALRKELEKKVNEMKIAEAKERDLTSEQCRVCQEFAGQFLDKTVSVF